MCVMSKAVLILLVVMCIVPTMAFSFSERDHENLVQQDHEYRQATDRLNRNWNMVRKNLKGDRFKIALDWQRQWLNSRSERIDALVRNGTSLAAAATLITNLQAGRLSEIGSCGIPAANTGRNAGRNAGKPIEDRLALLECAVQWSGKYTCGEHDGEPFEVGGMTCYPDYGETVISLHDSDIAIRVFAFSPRGSSCDFEAACTVIDTMLVCRSHEYPEYEHNPVATAYLGMNSCGRRTIRIIEAPEGGWCGAGAQLTGEYTRDW